MVLARGQLSSEDPALAVRIALALPLGGVTVLLALVEAASALALADPPDLGPWSGGLVAELEALVNDEIVPVLVELESLAELGLAERTLRQGVEVLPSAELIAVCSAARSCLVL